MPPLDFVIPIFLLLLFSLSIHEAAHAWTADRLGDPTARRLGRITLNPMAHIDWIGTVLFPLLAILSPGLPLLGWAKPVPGNWQNLRAPRRDFAIVAAAGPISNLVLAVIAALVFTVLYGESGVCDSLTGFWLGRAVILNVMLAVFNLIPVPPLDGGNVLAGLLPEQFAQMLDQLRPWGFLILYALLFAGVLSRIVVPLANTIIDWLI